MPDSMKELYTKGEYAVKNPTFGAEDSPWKARHIARMIERNGLRPSSVCSVGCGSGEVLSQLYQILPDRTMFSGFDISPQAFELAQQRAKDRLQFFLGDFLETDSYVDLLLAIDVIEHVEDYFGFLRALRGKAEHKIFHIPLDISVQRVLLSSPILGRRKQLGHIHYFTKETALATLEDTGYEIIDQFYTGGTLDFPAASLKYALGKWPLRFATWLNQDMAVRILGGHSLMVLAR